MANINAIRGETTYDITGLTTEQAATLLALISMNNDNGWYTIYDGLEEALLQDPAFRRRKIMTHTGALDYPFYTQEI